MSNGDVISLSSGSRKTRIETLNSQDELSPFFRLSSGSRKTRIETWIALGTAGSAEKSLSSGSRKTRIETTSYQLNSPLTPGV